MKYSYNSKKVEKTIIILSSTNTMAPRVRLVKKSLEEAGCHIKVLYRNRIFFKFRTIIGIPAYYIKTLKKCMGKNISAVQLTHISQIFICPILKLMQKIVVYDAYERFSVDISELHFRGWVRKPAKLIIEMFENLIIRFFVDAVFVVSTPNEYLYDRYKKYCGITEFLYNVPSLNSVFNGSIAKKFEKNLIKIVYVGGIGSTKGSDFFIPLSKALVQKKLNFELHLIGPFSSKHIYQSLVSEIINCKLSKFIFIHGYMDYNSMMRSLYNCHIGLNLTPYSKRLSLMGVGSSRKNFTYMCAGAAIIATDVGQMAYSIKQYRCGMVINEPSDIDKIVSIIEELSINRYKCVKFAENGIKAIKYQYNWEKEEQKVHSTYKVLFSDYNL